MEALIVASARRGALGKADVEALLTKARIKIVPFSEEDIPDAYDAYQAYGKSRHPAGLNFCDCVAYALGKAIGEPLLFKGNDFAKTDIVAGS